VATASTSGISGYFSDKVGERRVLVIGLLAFSFGLISAMASVSFVVFVISIAASGLGGGIMLTAGYSAMGRLVRDSRGIGMGVMNSVYSIGGFVGPFVTTTFLASSSWRTPFMLFGILGIGIIVPAYLFGAPKARSPIKSDPRSTSKLGLLRDRNIIVICVAMLLADFGFLAFISWTPTFMREELSMSAELVGFWFGLAIASGSLGGVFTGYLFDKIGGKKATMIAGLSSAALTFMLFVRNDYASTVVFLVLSGFFANCFFSLLTALAQESVEQEDIGTATGIVHNVGRGGTVIAPYIAGIIAMGTDVSQALVITVSLPFLLYPALMLMYRHNH